LTNFGKTGRQTVINNQQDVDLWLIVPLLSNQTAEIADFIKQHQWFFDDGGNAIFKISGVVEHDIMPIFSSQNIHILQIPDVSLYEAWNQSLDYLQRTKIGEDSYISFLGLDDLWSKEFIIQAVKIIFEQKKVDFIFGNSRHLFHGRYIDRESPEHPALFGENDFIFDVPHPGMLNRWGAISTYRFDTNFRLAADFDFYIGVTLAQKPIYKKVNCIQAELGASGVSNGPNAKKIYLEEWKKIKNKREVELNLNLGRTKIVEFLSRWPNLFQKIRRLWWLITTEKY